MNELRTIRKIDLVQGPTDGNRIFSRCETHITVAPLFIHTINSTEEMPQLPTFSYSDKGRSSDEGEVRGGAS